MDADGHFTLSFGGFLDNGDGWTEYENAQNFWRSASTPTSAQSAVQGMTGAAEEEMGLPPVTTLSAETSQALANKIESFVSFEAPIVKSVIEDDAKWLANTVGGMLDAARSNSPMSMGSDAKDTSAPAATAPKNGETAATKAGKEAHKNYNPGPGYDTKVRFPSGKRPDAVNWDQQDVRELKPGNPRAQGRGQTQVEGYRQELEKATGKRWTSGVDSY